MNAAPSRSQRAGRSWSGLTSRVFLSAADRAVAASVEVGLERVESGLVAQVAFADQVADVTTRYLLNAGGKRVRPLLTLLTAQLGEGITDDVVTAAQAVEILHLASLYHDDVMDESAQRRGVPSAQTVWGNSVAILAGDLLFARSSRLIGQIDESGEIGRADTFERLVLGQLHETIGPAEGDDPIEHYLQVLRDKTGSLISAAAEWGVLCSHAPDEYRAPLAHFGESIGVAFQLVDDVIDLSPSPAATGKVPGTDIRKGVPTLPMLYLRRRAVHDMGDAALLARIEGARGESPEAVASAVAELREHPVTAETLREADRWAAEGVGALDVLPDGLVRTALRRLAKVLVERSA